MESNDQTDEVIDTIMDVPSRWVLRSPDGHYWVTTSKYKYPPIYGNECVGRLPFFLDEIIETEWACYVQARPVIQANGDVNVVVEVRTPVRKWNATIRMIKPMK